MPDLSITISEDPCRNEIKELAVAVFAKHNASFNIVLPQEKPFSVLGFKSDRVVAGLIGKVAWNWLYADLVWVDEDLRGQGLGTHVMRAAERSAREKKLSGIYLWTASWQAPIFYRKLGYTQFAEFRDCPPGHSRLGFLKYLA